MTIHLNYQRGALRLWLIASVLWIACVGWIDSSEIAAGLQSRPVVEDVPPLRNGPITPEELFARSTAAADARNKANEAQNAKAALPAIAGAVFLPPLMLLVLGVMFGWVRRGFRYTEKAEKEVSP